jgi:hypothetical protein
MYWTPTAVGTQMLSAKIHHIPHWNIVCRLADRLPCSRPVPWRLCCIVTVLPSNRSGIPSSVRLESGPWITCSSNEHVPDYKRTHTYFSKAVQQSTVTSAFHALFFWWNNNKQRLWPTRSPNVNLCNFCLCGLLRIKRCDKYYIENYLTKLSIYCP